MQANTLVLLSPLKAFMLPNDKVVLTEKFVDGTTLYKELWDGPILHLCEPAQQPSGNLDNIEYPIKSDAFDTICAPFNEDLFRRAIRGTALVLTSVGEKFNSVAAICNELSVPCVYVSEYNLRTRKQIISENQKTVVHGWWKKYKQTAQELHQRAAIVQADGVQCNGLPTYQDYKPLNKNAHLFFDTRSTADMLSNNEIIAEKCAQLRQGKVIELVFSGRLNLMKGVDDLVRVAKHLRPLLRDRFHMTICGDGEYAPQLRKDIADNGLTDFVTMKGNLDFKTELVPFVTQEADLFVCCHRQGDPSCTYLETMASGVPVVGYDNDAWKGLSELSLAGESTPMGDHKTLAETIASLERTPEAIETLARRSLAFAADHTFEKTFDRRVDHLKAIASRNA